MTKQETYDFLKQSGVWFEVTEHEAVFTMEALMQVEVPYPEADAKNLFVRDDKKRNYYLITVKGDKRVDLKEFRRQHGTRPLSFASADDLLHMLHLTPGSVTPLGLLSDESASVQFCLDEEFLQTPAIVGVHPNDNTATVWLRAEDLMALIRAHGNPVTTVKL